MKSNNYEESYVLTPGVRILSDDDTKTLKADLTMEDFIIQGTFFHYQMVKSKRKTLHLSWSADEILSYTESIGK